MAVTKLTFDGSLNTAKQDAYFNYYITNKQNGIVKGLGNECSCTASNGTITFKDGFISIYGRRVFIENGTSIKISLDSTKYGYVVLSVDTSKNEASIVAKEGTSSSYPSLTQTNLLDEDGVYEQPICSYYKTSSSLSIGTIGITYVKTLDELLNDLNNELTTKINAIQNGMKYIVVNRKSVSGTKQTFDLSAYKSKDDLLIHFTICGTVVSTSLRQINNGYGLYLPYYYLGTWYNLEITYSGTTLTMYAGESTHNIKKLYINY